MTSEFPETYQTELVITSEKSLKNTLLETLTGVYKFDFEDNQGCFLCKKRYWIGKIDKIYLVPEKLGYPNNKCGIQCEKQLFGTHHIVLVVNDTKSIIDALCDIANTTQISIKVKYNA